MLINFKGILISTNSTFQYACQLQSCVLLCAGIEQMAHAEQMAHTCSVHDYPMHGTLSHHQTSFEMVPDQQLEKAMGEPAPMGFA